MSEVPTVQPGQTCAPTRAGSRAKARVFDRMEETPDDEFCGGYRRFVRYRRHDGVMVWVSPQSWNRWVRSCDARVVGS